MVDSRVKNILKFSNVKGGAVPPIGDIEKEFTNLSASCFAAGASWDPDLQKYGFDFMGSIHAIAPFCIHRYATYTGMRKYPELKTIIDEIKRHISGSSYPIIAGSAVFLGVGHDNCADIDLATYVCVGTTDEHRIDVGRKFKKFVDATNPEYMKIAYLDGKKLGNKRSKISIGNLVNRLIGSSPDPQKIANFDYAMLTFLPDKSSLNKEITLKLHFIHANCPRHDIYPYQELHECNQGNFFHSNKPWLALSFIGYFRFLYGAVQPASVQNNLPKTVKRAAMLAGMAGMWNCQDELINHINGCAPLTPGSLQSGINKLRTLLSPLVACGGDIDAAAAAEH